MDPAGPDPAGTGPVASPIGGTGRAERIERPPRPFSRPAAREHPASSLALARIAGTLVIDGGVIDPGSD